MLKPLERAGKLLIAYLAAALLWRPTRRAQASSRLAHPRRILLVRVDDRVGEALLTTPLFKAARALPSAPTVDILLHPKVARVLSGHPELSAVHTFDPKERKFGPFSKTVRDLRRLRYDVVVSCASWDAPSVGPAILARLVAPHAAIIAPNVAPTNLLADVLVPPRADTRNEAAQRLHFLSALGADTSDAQLSFRPTMADAVVQDVLASVKGAFAIVNPGGRLGERRVPPSIFAAAARALTSSGIVALVTFGPKEEALAREVAEGAPGAKLAPPTTVDQLAALMVRARLTVCNNTGPMHLSVAVGTPTLGLFYKMELARWGHPHAPHRMIDLTLAKDAEADVVGAIRGMLESAAVAS